MIDRRFIGSINKIEWIWSFIGVISLLIALGIISSRSPLDALMANAISASFLAIAALGQMFVFTTGRGAADLSIPGVITISAFMTTRLVGGSSVNLLYGLPLILLVGVLIGFANGVFVTIFRIPPIIATLGMGYVLITFSLVLNEGFAAFKTCSVLLFMTRNKFLGLPIIVIFVIIVALLCAFVLKKIVYGRALLALGQNIFAAYFSGINIRVVEILAYVISGALAALAGIFLSARVGGAFLGMGDSYLMETIGAVVIGGTAVAGGKASIIGTLFACLFLILLTTVMQSAGISIGLQNILKGVLIVLALAFMSSGEKEK
ncbi:MAG TPA: ABC transporter permease [Candidatus Atribacteria bacterium]|nr:ABC transporter permease [Candidatus Atribacteria bacterium]